MTDQRVPIAETFVSIQGEGMLTGTPSWFVRASGCNLRCRWCDTPYASWNPEGPARHVDDLLDEAAAIHARTGVRHAVLTGGEPLLFPALGRLSEALRSDGWHVTAETAGTLPADRPPFHAPMRVDLLSLSPKLADSTPRRGFEGATGAVPLTIARDAAAIADRHERDRLRPDVLRALLDRHPTPHRQLKFVVPTDETPESAAAARATLDEIDALVADLPGVRPDEVFLMPEGVRTPGPEHRRSIIDACLARGWRYAHRLHLELFGDTRGT